jgi:hypothetical protein
VAGYVVISQKLHVVHNMQASHCWLTVKTRTELHLAKCNIDFTPESLVITSSAASSGQCTDFMEGKQDKKERHRHVLPLRLRHVKRSDLLLPQPDYR